MPNKDIKLDITDQAIRAFDKKGYNNYEYLIVKKSANGG